MPPRPGPWRWQLSRGLEDVFCKVSVNNSLYIRSQAVSHRTVLSYRGTLRPKNGTMWEEAV